MQPAADKLALELERISFGNAEPPVVTNVEATPNARGDRVADLLRRQVTAPVRFTEMIETLAQLGVTHFLEIGPGRVLSGLVARIQRRVARAALSTPDDLDEVRGFLASVGS